MVNANDIQTLQSQFKTLSAMMLTILQNQNQSGPNPNQNQSGGVKRKASKKSRKESFSESEPESEDDSSSSSKDESVELMEEQVKFLNASIDRRKKEKVRVMVRGPNT